VDRRAAALAALSGLLVAAGVSSISHQPTPGQRAAQAVERAMAEAQPPLVDAEAVEDERLTGDANEAGYRWAERRALNDATDCPNYSAAFRTGCADYVAEQGAGR
jgi:hypothetical protein